MRGRQYWKLKWRFCGTVGGFKLDAEFNLAPSGITALSGPSGSGKTTLLRCIAGLTRLPGSFYVGDEVWQDPHKFVAPHRRSVLVSRPKVPPRPPSPTRSTSHWVCGCGTCP